MNSVDKISKEAKILLDSAKDLTVNNLLNAFKTNQLSLDESQLNRLLSLVSVSIEEGYQRALPTYQNTIKKHVK